MKKSKTICNVISVIFLIAVLATIILVIEPLLYNSKTKPKALKFNDDNVAIVNTCFYKYEKDLFANNIKALKSYFPLLRKKSLSIYADVSEYLKSISDNDYQNVIVDKITKVGNGKYRVDYNINNETKDGIVIIRINKNNKTFTVLYDSLIH